MSIHRFALCCAFGGVMCLLAACSENSPVVLEPSPLVAGPSATSRTCLELYTHTVRLSDGTLWETTPHVRVQLRNPGSGTAVWGGAVTVNGVRLDSHHVLNNVFYECNRWLRPVPLRLGDRYQVFTVAGGEEFPALTDSVASLSEKTSVHYPTPADTVSRSAGLVVRWKPSNADRVLVRVGDGAGTGMIQKEVAGDPGICTIPASELAALEPGSLKLSVARSISREGVAGGRAYELRIGSVQDIRATLVP